MTVLKYAFRLPNYGSCVYPWWKNPGCTRSRRQAIFGITEEPYIVFTANAFALLGLRALFFLVKGLLDELVYLSTGLALILAFIGVKLVLHWGHGIDDRVPEISTNLSLVVIAVVLTVTTIASLIKVRLNPTIRAHAGSLTADDPPDSERTS
ncbi:hypothetical protein E3T35_16740 [Cryobacterium sp. TMT1-2-2]|uniref:TerC family protein n=1 Tax=Cryobacterium sp. TMT1-2-2 TaxID=1259233 RepID=UPI00106ABA97|nr:hypothetical protein E3T35_16740 [Cryobacterium sp. TMT1-2-2]